MTEAKVETSIPEKYGGSWLHNLHGVLKFYSSHFRIVGICQITPKFCKGSDRTLFTTSRGNLVLLLRGGVSKAVELVHNCIKLQPEVAATEC